MRRGRISLATCQFADGKDVTKNAAAIRRLMVQANQRGADVVVFHEGALSGYPADLSNLGSNPLLQKETESIIGLSRKLKVWTILGSAHCLSGRNKPHNSLYAISPAGRIIDRYDKRFCTTSDLKHYSPGDHLCVFEINGIRCGMLICYDVRFFELYREYVKLNVRLMFHCFSQAGTKDPNGGLLRVITRPTLQALAAANHMFVCAPNSSNRHQEWPGVFVTPDGRIEASNRLNTTGMILNTVDLKRHYHDASHPWRDRALRGVLHSGTPVNDVRSRKRTAL